MNDTMTFDPTTVGLCDSCTHARRIESSRGSVFLLCALSQTDPTFPRYPRLPVLACSGYSLSRPAEKDKKSSA